ncbi:MAG: hypothetical protein ABIH28_01655 [archaeon]
MAVAQDLVSSLPVDLANNLSFLANILQALGIAIVFYILFNIIGFFFSRRREKKLEKISKNLEAIKRLLIAQSKRK